MQWPTWFGGPDYQRAARPYFAPDEGKGLIQWPYDPRAAPSIAVLGGILGVGMIAFALLFEPWPVPSWNLVFAGIVATVVTLGFSFASRQPAALAFDRKGLVAGRARPVAWRDVENLTLGIGIAPVESTSIHINLLTVRKRNGGTSEIRLPPIDVDDRETLAGMLEGLSREHRFHFNYIPNGR